MTATRLILGVFDLLGSFAQIETKKAVPGTSGTAAAFAATFGVTLSDPSTFVRPCAELPKSHLLHEAGLPGLQQRGLR